MRRSKRKAENRSFYEGYLYTFSIIVPVKNEGKVIGRLLDALLRLRYPKDKMEIIIVEDGSTDGTILLVHAAFHGWALLYLDNSSIQIVNYRYAIPEEVAQAIFEDSHLKVYLIWWIPGEGWHGLASLPPCFIEVFRSGRIAAYEYVEV